MTFPSLLSITEAKLGVHCDGAKGSRGIHGRRSDIGEIGLRGQSAIGLVAFIFIAWGFSTKKSQFPFFAAIWAVGAQILIAAFLLFTPPARAALASLQVAVQALQEATAAGTTFVFGHLGGGDTPFEVVNEGAMFSFAFGALPLVIFFSGLSGGSLALGYSEVVRSRICIFVGACISSGGSCCSFIRSEYVSGTNRSSVADPTLPR